MMKLVEVKSKKEEKQFLNIVDGIYKNDPHFIRPLDIDISSVFDSNLNNYFENGEAIRWLLFNENGSCIGRIAAFIDHTKCNKYDQPTGGIGFFECIDDQKAANLMFERCRFWLEERGMQAMDGPINFGPNEKWWGLLVDGFIEPGYGVYYHPPYYKKLFEAYGFEAYFNQITRRIDLSNPFSDRFRKIAQWVLRKPGYSFKHFTFKDQDRFLQDFKIIHDDAWKYHEHFVPITISEIKKELNDAKFLLEEEFIWYVYHEDKPIAVVVMFPDFNQLLKPLNGKMNLCGKIKLLFLRRTKKFTTARITVMGVVERFQKSGIESGLFYHMEKMMKNHPEYKTIELAWVGDFNPRMEKLHEALGGIFSKKHTTYRKMFIKGAQVIPPEKL